MLFFQIRDLISCFRFVEFPIDIFHGSLPVNPLQKTLWRYYVLEYIIYQLVYYLNISYHNLASA